MFAETGQGLLVHSEIVSNLHQLALLTYREKPWHPPVAVQVGFATDDGILEMAEGQAAQTAAFDRFDHGPVLDEKMIEIAGAESNPRWRGYL